MQKLIKKITFFISKNKSFVFSFSFAILYTTFTFAAPYTISDAVLNPTCLPGALDCYVSVYPDQTGNSGKFLTTNGTVISWASVASGGGSIGDAVGSGTAGSVLFIDSSGFLAQAPTSFFYNGTSNRLGVGTNAPAAKIHSLATTEQLRLGYDASNYWTSTVGSSGGLTMQGVGVGGSLSLIPTAGQNLNISLSTTGDFVLNTNQLYVDTSTGYVGIGDATPSYILDVAGDALINGVRIGMGEGSVATNTALGASALNANTTGANNVAVGASALVLNTGGVRNSAVGSGALASNTSGNNNTAVGYQSMNGNTIGSLNTAFGFQSLFSTTTGNLNTAIGYEALRSNTTGDSNVVLGYGAGYNPGVNGAYTSNVLLGYQAGNNITDGATGNIVIGHDIDLPTAGGTGQMTIGNLIFATGLGATGTTVSTGSIGIGTASPGAEFVVAKNGGEIVSSNAGQTRFVSLYSDNNPGIFYNASEALRFGSVSSFAGGGFSEKMRLDNSGNLTIGGSTSISKLAIPIAPTASANYGLVSLGSGAFDGSTSGFFTGSANGTMIAANQVSGGTADLINVQLAGANRFKVTSAGLVGINTTTPAVPLDVTGDVRIRNGGQPGFAGWNIGQTAAGPLVFSYPSQAQNVLFMNHSTGFVGLSNNAPDARLAVTGSSNNPSFVARNSSSAIGLWVDDSANVGVGGLPVSKLTIPVAPTASANYGLVSLGSGAFDGSTSGFFTGVAAGTGLAMNLASGSTSDLLNLQIAGVSKFKIASDGRGTFAGTIVSSSGEIQASSGGYIGFGSRSYFSSPADGKILLSNSAISDFGLLQLGGTTSSFPAIKRNSADIQFRLADDSAYANIRASDVNAASFTNSASGIVNINSTMYVNIGNNLTSFMGTTSSFPALKRNATGLDIRLADDSGYAPLTAGNITANGNTNGGVIIKSENVNAGSSAYAEFQIRSDVGYGAFFANSSTNTNYGGAGALNFIQVNNYPMAFGTNNAVRMTIKADGLIAIGDGVTSSFPALKRSGTGLVVRLADDSADAPITASAGTFSGLVSCGGIQTNGSGLMSCTSDERLKDVQGDFTTGLEAIRGINPKAFSWKQGSAMYDNGVVYNGFIAQNIQASIPEAVSLSSDGIHLQVSQLTLLATTINAIKEIDTKIVSIENLNTSTPFIINLREWLASAANGIQKIFSKEVETENLCVSDVNGKTCITKAQLDLLLQNAGGNSGGSGSSGSTTGTSTGADTGGEGTTDTGSSDGGSGDATSGGETEGTGEEIGTATGAEESGATGE